MKLLPPKPPISAEAAKIGKKAKKEVSIQDASSTIAGAETISAIKPDYQNSSNEQVAVLEPAAHEEAPSISAAEDTQNIDKVLESMGNVSAEKKKGFFSRLFGKSEKKTEVSVAAVDIPPLDNADNAPTLDSYVDKSLENSATPVAQVTNTEQDLIEQTMESMPQAPSAADLDEEIPAFPSKTYSKYSYSKYAKPYMAENMKTEYVKNKPEYSKYDSKENNSKAYSGKAAYNKNKEEETSEIQLDDDWDVELSKVEPVSEAVEKTKEEKESKKTSKTIFEDTDVPIKNEPSSMQKVSANADFSIPLRDWREDATNEAMKSPSTEKAKKQLDLKLKKLLKSHEARLSKMADAAKKSVAAEIAKANKKISEISKKEKIVSSKETKLLHLEKSLTKERTEFDALVETEKQLMKSKEVLESDVLRYTGELTDIKSELSKLKKEFLQDKKVILAEKARLQSEFRDAKAAIENERRKGEKKLSELVKQVEEAEHILDETNRKNKEISAKLHSKEVMVEQREREVKDLIEQEQKIVAILRGAQPEIRMAHHRKSKSERPATMLNAEGEPEIYSDDEDIISKKIEDCKDLLKEENYEDAKLLYNELREEFMKCSLDDSRKKKLNHEIRELYDEICLSIVSPRS